MVGVIDVPNGVEAEWGQFQIKGKVSFNHGASQGIQSPLGGGEADLIRSTCTGGIGQVLGGVQVLLGRFQLLPDGLTEFCKLAQEFANVTFDAGCFLSCFAQFFLSLTLEIGNSQGE